jgi:hypothetical protein
LLWQPLIAGTTSIGQAGMISPLQATRLPLQQLGVEIDLRHEFETRSLPRSLAATRRGFAFYLADPISSLHEFTRRTL